MEDYMMTSFPFVRGLATTVLVFVNLALPQDEAKEGLRSVCHSSEASVHGVVVGKSCLLSADQRNIITIVDVKVTEWISGNAGASSIKIEMAGGKVGSLVETVIPQPRYEIGEELIVFLLKSKTQTPNLYRVCLSGKYNVEGRRGEKWIYQDTGEVGATLVSREVNSMLLDEAVSIIKNVRNGR